MLILVCGLPATGKSTIALKLAKRIGATLLRTDIIRKEIFSAPSYSKEEKELVYRIMFLVAKYLLRSGKRVVIDGTFYKKAFREEVYEIARKTRSRLEILECVAPESVIKERMECRKTRYRASDADYEVYLKLKQEFEPIEQPHLVIDTSLPSSQNMKEIFAKLRLG